MHNILTKYVKRISVVLAVMYFAGCSASTQAPLQKVESKLKTTNNWLNLDTVKAGKFDTGKMWTFEYPPIDYFKAEYGFAPSQEWLDNVRESALKFANYCSASFVSADGLVLTNHHCARQSVTQVTKEGEDLHATGFNAATLEDERPVPGLYVDQLVLIKDVTDIIQSAIDQAKTSEEKNKNEKNAIAKLQQQFSDSTGLKISVTKLFNGGKYSLYGYKRYNDVRLVFAPEDQAGFFGGDPDNFTYPRYDLDFSLFRVYDEDGNPLKTDRYFKFSKNGASAGEAVFVVGNPGRTNRLNTVSQLEYYRDKQYPRVLDLLDGLVSVYSKYINLHPDQKPKLQDRLFGFSNSQKAYGGMLAGLRDPILMQKKRDFEKTFYNAVMANPKLKDRYGNHWHIIDSLKKEESKIYFELSALSINRFTSPAYFFIAEDLIDLAEEIKLPEDQRREAYRGAELDSTIANIFPENFDKDMNDLLLEMNANFMTKYLGNDYPLVQKMFAGKTGMEAVDYALSNSSVTSPEKIKELASKGSEAILNSDDPFIYFVLNSKTRREELKKKSDELSEQEAVYSQELGKALFEVYGTSIPPDATFTLRISDGVVKGYKYNGTEAPTMTTFFGMYDRYYSFDKQYPWMLPDRYKNPPAEFDLNTPMDFVSTNDIIGGNSGSPVINKNAEIVGVAFDGNIESLPGNFIFTTESNRTVSVHSSAILEALNDLYNAKRLADELREGKIVPVEEAIPNNH